MPLAVPTVGGGGDGDGGGGQPLWQGQRNGEAGKEDEEEPERNGHGGGSTVCDDARRTVRCGMLVQLEACAASLTHR